MLRLAAPMLVLAMASASGAHAGGLCTASETTYFTCETRQKKSVSICGTPSSLQYRFGRPGAVELEFPQDAAQGPGKLLYAHHFRAAADRTEVSFSSGSTTYAVFEYAEASRRRAGVRVEAGGQGGGAGVRRAGAQQVRGPRGQDSVRARERADLGPVPVSSCGLAEGRTRCRRGVTGLGAAAALEIPRS